MGKHPHILVPPTQLQNFFKISRIGFPGNLVIQPTYILRFIYEISSEMGQSKISLASLTMTPSCPLFISPKNSKSVEI